MKDMFIYQTDPIDHWTGYLSITKAVAEFSVSDRSLIDLLLFISDCFCYLKTAKGSYWEGDIRGDEFGIFAIPSIGENPRLGLVFKQDNNGTSFVFSPIEIPWLLTQGAGEKL